MSAMSWKHVLGAVTVAAALAVGAALHAQQPVPAAGAGKADAVAALKQSLQQGLAKARGYEWVETTIISLKGEEKARKQNRCYYGADGKVQKVSLDAAPAAEKPQAGGGGRRGGRIKEKVVENKKDEMQEYMKSAAALIHSYVPPDPGRIQAAKDAGRVATTPQGGGMRLAISQYLQPGDTFTIDLDPSGGKLLGLAVNTYLEKKEDVVTLDVKMNTLADGALYAAQTTLEAKAKNITVVIQNTGHRPVQK
jgi:hypothetical protein